MTKGWKCGKCVVQTKLTNHQNIPMGFIHGVKKECKHPNKEVTKTGKGF